MNRLRPCRRAVGKESRAGTRVCASSTCRRRFIDLSPSSGTLAALAACAWASASAEASCGLVEEYAIRLCTSSRALRTCNSTWIVAPGVNTTCGWRDDCQRCVSPPEAFDNPCSLDGLNYGQGGSCPKPHDNSFCEECELIITQEVCLGLCSENCIWSNVSWMEGEHCLIRDPEPEVDDNTLIMILIIAGGVIGLIALIIGIRIMAAMRRRALEAQSTEIRNRLSDRFSGLAVTGAGGGPVMGKRLSDRRSAGSEARISGMTPMTDASSNPRMSGKRESFVGLTPEQMMQASQKRSSLHGTSPDVGAAGAPKKKPKDGKGKKVQKKEVEVKDDDEATDVSTSDEEEEIHKYMADDPDEDEEEDAADSSKAAAKNKSKK